jgi:hypothetical protein
LVSLLLSSSLLAYQSPQNKTPQRHREGYCDAVLSFRPGVYEKNENRRAAWESHPPDHSESVVMSHRTAHTELCIAPSDGGIKCPVP